MYIHMIEREYHAIYAFHVSARWICCQVLFVQWPAA